MPKCPQCTKPLHEITRRCPSCQADLDLLVDYVSHLQGGLERADNLVKAGELGQAIWAYLEVLEVDPDNTQARKQVGMIVTAVRQFDVVMPGRRWAKGLPPIVPPTPRPWWHWAILAGVLVVASAITLGIGYAWGAGYEFAWQSSLPQDLRNPDQQLGAPPPAKP